MHQKIVGPGPFKLLSLPTASSYSLEFVSLVTEGMLCPHHVPEELPSPISQELAPIVPEDNQFLLSDILAWRKSGHIMKYLVHWEGYSDKYNQRANEGDINRVLVQKFHSSNGKRRSRGWLWLKSEKKI